MKDFTSYLRVLFIVTLVFLAAEYFIDSGNKPAFMVYPEVIIFITLFTITLIGVEIIVGALKSIAEALMTEDQKKALEIQKIEAKNNIWYKKLYKKLLGQRPIEEEGELILDHNYDGIRELDNSLPPWWVYGFYATILFSVIYLAKYHIFDGDTQIEEYNKELVKAQIDIEEYKKTAKDLVDINTVQLLTEASDLNSGKTIYTTNCAVCHIADGGGRIGPNLTDQYWILGGGIKNVFKTISEGGRDGKGMISWKQTLKPSEIAQVASYVLTFQGTTPAEPKVAEGDLWIDENAPKPEIMVEEVKDSLNVIMR
jgi:cytochrome c oxidase cbb3-type subunit 3